MAEDLIVIDQPTVLQAFQSPDGLSGAIEEVRAVVAAFDHDMSTCASRKRTASLSNGVARVKVRLDDIGKELVADWKRQAADVDKNRRAMRVQLDGIKEEARRPLTEWEQAEATRVEGIRAAMAAVESMASLVDERGMMKDLSALKESLDGLSAVSTDAGFDERQAIAEMKRTEGIAALSVAIEKEEERLRVLAELEELRRQHEIAAQELAKREEDERAIESNQAAPIDSPELPSVEQPVLERKGADKPAPSSPDDTHVGAETVIKNIAMTRAKNAAFSSLVKVAGLQREQAILVVQAISDGKISNVTINY